MEDPETSVCSLLCVFQNELGKAKIQEIDETKTDEEKAADKEAGDGKDGKALECADCHCCGGMKHCVSVVQVNLWYKVSPHVSVICSRFLTQVV